MTFVQVILVFVGIPTGIEIPAPTRNIIFEDSIEEVSVEFSLVILLNLETK